MPEAPDRDPFRLIGTVIDGKYRVVELVGEGGFGVVYRGRHEGFDSPIAIKCLKVPANLDEAARESLLLRLREEGRILHKLSTKTPAIVQALDLGAFTPAGGVWMPYLVLEWLEGTTLSAFLRARRAAGSPAMALEEAIALLAPAARALSTAHAERIAHRDVKPDNLFVLRDRGSPAIKVLDFGIAKVVADETGMMSTTGSGQTSFTPGYGAPEQFDKRLGATGPWTDVFALALVVVEVVSGRRALPGSDFADLFRAALDPDLRPTLRAQAAECPEPVEQVLARALRVEPHARFAAVGAFWDALEAAAKGAVVSSSPDPGPELGALPTADFVERRAGRAAPEQNDPAFSPTIPAAERTRASAPPTERSSARPGELDRTLKGARSLAAKLSAPVKPPPPVIVIDGHAGHEARRAARTWVLMAGLATLAAALFFLLRPGGTTSSGTGSSATPASSPAPPPLSASPEAAAAYREAMQAHRDGNADAAVRLMQSALAKDPEMPAAALRLSIWRFRERPDEAREHYQKAVRRRDALSPEGAALLLAAEPYMRQPSDLAEWEKRLAAAGERSPGEAELWVYACDARLRRFAFNEAIAACERALAADPGYAYAWSLKGQALGFNGDAAGEQAAYDECLQKSASATSCLKGRIRLSGQKGQCAAMAEDARRWIAIDRDSAAAYTALAAGLFTSGDTRESVLTALQLSWTRGPSRGPDQESRDRLALAVNDGDFDGARKLVQAWEERIAGKADQAPHGNAALELARLHEETGKDKEAGEAARAFLTRMGAWAEPASGGDWAISFLPFARRAGLVSTADFERGRAAWAERVRARWRGKAGGREADLDWILWLDGHAAPVRSEAEARAALEALPKTPLPQEGARWFALDAELGKVLALGGRAAEAVPHLSRMVHSCAALAEPWKLVRSSYYLGLALEASGDKPGAVAAYRALLAKWGAAKPRSVTAEKARARLRALGENP